MKTLPPTRPSTTPTTSPSAVDTIAQARLLGAFLRSRREQLVPSALGLTAGRRVRRTPGLRREEVARLSGVGTTWYQWLEQGRDIRPSGNVLHWIGQALRLTADEQAYVLQLAGLSAAPPPEPRDAVPPSLMHLVDSLKDIPAALINRRWDILAWNKTAGALFGLNSLPPEDLNSMICMFDNPHLRSLLGEDWATIARTQLANFRRSSGPLLATPWFTQLVARLLQNSPEFRDWWPLQEVSACPVGMPINATLQSQRLQLALEIFVHNEGKLILGIYNPKNQETAEELRKLTSRRSGVTESL